MSTPNSDQSDPPEIRGKLESLRHQIKVIEDLSKLVEIAQIERKRLENEIQLYRASVAPIRKCPAEVLLMIFKLFSCKDPKLATRLLRVCRQWYEIAMNSPGLWTYIEISTKCTWNQQKEAMKDNAKAAACLQRSASLPLRICLDFRAMDSGRTNMIKHATNLLEGSIPVGKRDSFRRNAGRLNLSAFIDSIDADIAHACRPDHVLDTISILTGERGEKMKRWGAFFIAFPQRHLDLIGPIWRLLSGPTPNLTRFVVFGVYMAQNSAISLTEGAFPDLSALKRLALHGRIVDLDFLSLQFHTIERLELWTDLRLHHQTIQLSRFKHLERLEIECHSDFLDNPGDTIGPVGRIELPYLQELTLGFKQAAIMKWEVPILQKLQVRYMWRDGDSVLPELPDVRALHFSWHILRLEKSGERTLELRQGLKEIVSKYKELQTLSVQSLLRPIWDQFVQDLGEEEQSALPALVFEY
jgi:F-box-like